MKFSSLLFSSTLLLMQNASAMDLDSFLSEVQAKNKIFKSIEASGQAASARKLTGDTSLMPVLTAKSSWLTDKNPKTYTPTLVQTGMVGTEYSLGLAKKFSSGTGVSATASLGEGDIEINNGASTAQATSSLSFALSQSLIKDSFGASTRLRWEREAYVESLEKIGLHLQAQAVLIDAETAFWDFIYLREELAIRKANLERANKLHAWMIKRVNNGIAERSDLVQIEALKASRELQLSITQDDFLAAQKKLRDLLETSDSQKLPEMQGKLDETRTLKQLLARAEKSGEVMSWEAYAAVLESKAKKVVASEVQDGLRPDLQLKAMYATHAYGDTLGEAQRDIAKTDKATQAISLEFTYLLDADTKSSVANVAKMEATSTELKAQRKVLEGKTQWQELNRRLDEMKNKVKSAAAISRLQAERAKLEQDKLSKGRTVTSQVIAAEQDAAEAELTHTKMKAEQRKIEARARMFVVVEETI